MKCCFSWFPPDVFSDLAGPGHSERPVMQKQIHMAAHSSLMADREVSAQVQE